MTSDSRAYFPTLFADHLDFLLGESPGGFGASLQPDLPLFVDTELVLLFYSGQFEALLAKLALVGTFLGVDSGVIS